MTRRLDQRIADVLEAITRCQRYAEKLEMGGADAQTAELAPLEVQMIEGRYPHQEIVAAFERKGLQHIDYWSEYLNTLVETRGATEARLQHV